MKEEKRIALTLSGGGVRGYAHVGVLKVFKRESIPIHLLTGTSMGGFMAAAFASGLGVDRLEAEMMQLSSPRKLLPLLDRAGFRRGLVKASRLIAHWDEILNYPTFDQLAIPLGLVAVDLKSGKRVVLREGSVMEAVRATAAVPGFFTPVERGDWLLVDGGLLDNVPADVAREMGATHVIAVDISTSLEAVYLFTKGLSGRRILPEALVETLDVLQRSMALLTMHANRQSLEAGRPDLIIRPAIPAGVTTMTGLRQAREVIDAGERAAQDALPQILELLEG